MVGLPDSVLGQWTRIDCKNLLMIDSAEYKTALKQDIEANINPPEMVAEVRVEAMGKERKC